MQNDSTLDQAKFPRFPQSMVDDMFNASCRFSHIIHLPTLGLSNSKLPAFEEFISKDDYQHSDFISQWPDLKNQLIDPDRPFTYAELLYIFSKNCPFDLLVCVQTPVPTNFQFSKTSKFISCSRSWGAYHTKWILANTMVKAGADAIEFADHIFNQYRAEALQDMKASRKGCSYCDGQFYCSYCTDDPGHDN